MDAASAEGCGFGTEVADEDEGSDEPHTWMLPKKRNRGSRAVSSNLCSQFCGVRARARSVSRARCQAARFGTRDDGAHLDFWVIRRDAEPREPKRHGQQLKEVDARVL